MATRDPGNGPRPTTGGGKNNDWPDFTPNGSGGWGDFTNRNKDNGGKDGGKGGGKDGGNDTPDPHSDAGESAHKLIEDTLATYGLGSLAKWAWDAWKSGDSIAEIMMNLRNTQEYKDRFPGLDELRKAGKGIDESSWIQYENSVNQISQHYGLPAGLYNDRKSIGIMLANDVSPVEVEDRIRKASSIVYGSPEVRQAFAQFYGTQGDSAAIAYFLDPEHNGPILEQQFAAAQLAGNLTINGMKLDKVDAQRIAQMGAFSEQEAQRAAALVGTQAELYQQLIGETGAPTVATGAEAALGLSGQAATAVEDQAARRKAAYQQGGGYAASQVGVSGLGSAER